MTLSPRLPGTEPGSDEERVLTVTFDDGSLLTVLGTTRGDDIRGVQEQIDIRRGKTTITIDDLWKMRSGRAGSSAIRGRCSATRPTRPCTARRSAGSWPASRRCIRSGTWSSSQRSRSRRVIWPGRDERAAGLPDWLSLAEQELS